MFCLKILNFLGEIFIILWIFLQNKSMNSTYEFTLKKRPKVKIENFWRTKSWRIFLEGLKQKVDIFIGTKNIFNPKFFNPHFLFQFLKIEKELKEYDLACC